MELGWLLNAMLEYGASDLYLTTDSAPIWRTDKFIRAEMQKLSEEDIRALMAACASPEELEKFAQTHELNIAYTDQGQNRFRMNFFHQRQKSGMVIRHIKKVIPTFEALGLPDVYKDAIMNRRGMVLVAGQSGSGKSTAIAAMLDYLNNNSSGHVITIEDPIEFVHEHKNCIFTQREVGIDTLSWDDALKNALRQRPDVIYIGEIRDAQTMMHALNYAETGHLCIATIHATTAAGCVERIANFSPTSLRSQNLYSLAHALKFIFAQRLIQGTKGKREIALEVLKNVGMVKPMIIKGAINEIMETMHKNADIGMATFEHSLLKLYDAGKISKIVAVEEADNPQNMELEIMKRANKGANFGLPQRSKNEF